MCGSKAARLDEQRFPAGRARANMKHWNCATATKTCSAGLVLSGGGMIAAAFGFITPVAGALLQELIDVAVILNALRTLRDEGR